MENAPDEQDAQNTKRKFESIVPPGVIKKCAHVSISYMEIYNENINDLLNAGKTNLEIREDRTTKNMCV